MLQSNFLVDYKNNNNNNKGRKRVAFPYKITKVENELNKKLLSSFTGERTGFVQVGPQKWFFPSGYEKQAENLYNFEARPDDVWIVTFPRSGTTWTQEMVWLLANNLDFEKASRVPLTARYPFLEFSCFLHEDLKNIFLNENKHSIENCELIEQISKPILKSLDYSNKRRFIKTHLPFSLLPPNLLEVGCKVIYVARNPKDVAVSYYHLNRSIRTQGYTGNFTEYWNYFENNLQPWTPYWAHVLEAWQLRHSENMLFLFYEEMNKVDLRQGILKIQNFLQKSYGGEQLDALEDYLKIENFRNNKSVNFNEMKQLGIMISGEEGFVRKGKTGSWNNYFDDELNSRANLWIKNNLKGSDLKFPNLNVL